MKYTEGEIQQIIDDLDYAKAYFPEPTDCSSDIGAEYKATMFQIRTSLSNASDILCDLPTEVIETMDHHRQIFIEGA